MSCQVEIGRGTRYHTVSEDLTTKHPAITKGQYQYQPNQASKTNETGTITCFLVWCIERTQHYFLYNSCQEIMDMRKHWIDSNEEHATKMKGLCHLKLLRITRLRNCPRVKETKETLLLNELVILGLDPGSTRKKRHCNGAVGKIWTGSWWYCCPCCFPDSEVYIVVIQQSSLYF